MDDDEFKDRMLNKIREDASVSGIKGGGTMLNITESGYSGFSWMEGYPGETKAGFLAHSKKAFYSKKVSHKQDYMELWEEKRYEREVQREKLNKMYEEQLIDYASLKDALRNRTNREMAKKGRFYINDERVVTKLRLKNDYKNILTPEQLKHILNSDVNKAIELYKLAPIGQKSTIVEIVKQSKFNGEDIDYNLLRELTKLSGVDLVNIEDVTKIEIKE